MADRQWINPIGGAAVNEEGTEEYVLPIGGAALQEDQATAPVAGGRLLLLNPPGLDGGFGTGGLSL